MLLFSDVLFTLALVVLIAIRVYQDYKRTHKSALPNVGQSVEDKIATAKAELSAGKSKLAAYEAQVKHEIAVESDKFRDDTHSIHTLVDAELSRISFTHRLIG